MNAITPAHPKGLQISTPNDTLIVLTPTFSAPRRLVWEEARDCAIAFGMTEWQETCYEQLEALVA
jgi:hypothetical protein